VAAALGPGAAGGIAFLLPTVVERGEAEQAAASLRLVQQVAGLRDARPELPLVFVAGMQWRDPAGRAEALRRLEALGGEALARRIPFVGMSLPGPGKIRTLNAAIAVAEGVGARGLAWVDDDVRLEPGCLAGMAERFLARGARGAVGATKVGAPKEYAASRLLFAAKSVMEPAVNYPHACCILVETGVVAGGIPPRYVSDDGYVCFRLLDPSLANPLEHLELVPGALCHYHVGGPAGETYRRIRRMLLNHHIYMADFPRPVARFYFRHVLFTGLWPLAPWDGSRGWRFGATKWALKWAYFGWFAAVGAELYLRGLLGRPLRRVSWGGYTRYEVPAPRGPA
jgi:hypothetical protein